MYMYRINRASRFSFQENPRQAKLAAKKRGEESLPKGKDSSLSEYIAYMYMHLEEKKTTLYYL